MKKRVFILLMTMIMMMGFNITVKAQADDGYDVDITEDCYDSENNTITIPSTFMSYGDPNFGDYTYPENGINAGYSMAETFYLVLTSVEEAAEEKTTTKCNNLHEGSSTLYNYEEVNGLIPISMKSNYGEYDYDREEADYEADNCAVGYDGIVYALLSDGWRYPVVAKVEYGVGDA